MLKICPNCGKEFDAKGHNAKFCNPKCQRAFKRKEKTVLLKKICAVCGKEFETTHSKQTYCSEGCYQKRNVKEKHNIICPNCGKVFEPRSNRAIFCCKDCADIFESKQKFKDVEGIVICKECGMMGHNLLKHIGTKHGSVEEYCQKHNCSRSDLISEQSHNNLSERQKLLMERGVVTGFTSEHNPSKGEDCKNGRNSPYSMNFRGYDNLTNEEKQQKINELLSRKIESTNDNFNNPKTIEYYIKRGFNEEEAQEKLSESQQTFTLEKCMEKYGEEEGRKRWMERQEKWLSNFPKNNYSMISQSLFNRLIDLVEDRNDIYYATNENGEYLLKTNDRMYKLDFYIEGLGKVIEFDGDYWHDQNKPGNKTRDERKTNDIINHGLQLLRVKEREYRKNPDKVIQECLEFLKS